MKDLRTTLRGISLVAWWRQKSTRERVLMVSLGLASGVYLVVSFGFLPLLAERREARAEIHRYEGAVARLAALPPVGELHRHEASTQPVTAIVTETATAAAIPIRRIEPSVDGALLTIEEAPFIDVLAWIDQLEAAQGLLVVSVEMERRPAPGLVSATLSLKR